MVHTTSQKGLAPSPNEHYSGRHTRKRELAYARFGAGFTLIEMLFYILFIIFIIGSTLGIVYQLLRNSENLKTGISVEEEGNFILKKISWVLNDTGAINSPALNSTATTLSVDKNDFGSGNPVVVSLDSGLIRIARDSGLPKQLSNDRFVVSGLSFERTWDGSNPETGLLKTSFYIGTRRFELTRKIR